MQQIFLGKYALNPYEVFNGTDYILVGKDNWGGISFDKTWYDCILQKHTEKILEYDSVDNINEKEFLTVMKNSRDKYFYMTQTGESDIPRIYGDPVSMERLLFKLWKTVFVNPDMESILHLYRLYGIDLRTKTFMWNNAKVFEYKRYFSSMPEEIIKRYQAEKPFEDRSLVLDLLPLDYLYLIRRCTKDDLGMTEKIEQVHQKHLWQFLNLTFLNAIFETKINAPIYHEIYKFDIWGKNIDEIIEGGFKDIHGTKNYKYLMDPQFGWTYNDLMDFTDYDRASLYYSVCSGKFDVFKALYPNRPDVVANRDASFFGLLNILLKENRPLSVNEFFATDHFYKWEHIKNMANFFGSNLTLLQFLLRGKTALKLWN